jgi:hypothetical protein
MKTLKVKAPAIVLRHTRSATEQLKDIIAPLAFKWGVAQPMHFDRISDMINLVYIASDMASANNQALNFCEAVVIPLNRKVEERYRTTGKLLADDAEQKALLEFYRLQDQFWAGQPGDRLHSAQLELIAYKQELMERRHGHH